MLALDPATRATLTPELAAAVGTTYAVAAGLMALAALAAAIGLRPAATSQEGARAERATTP